MIMIPKSKYERLLERQMVHTLPKPEEKTSPVDIKEEYFVYGPSLGPPGDRMSKTAHRETHSKSVTSLTNLKESLPAISKAVKKSKNQPLKILPKPKTPRVKDINNERWMDY